MLADIAFGIGEIACGGIAMIGCDDQAAARRKALYERPEVIAGELIGSILGQRVQTLTGNCRVVNLAVWPVVPEHPVGRTIDQALAVLPRHVEAFSLRRLQAMRQSAPIVLKVAAAAEAESASKLVRLTGEFRGVRRDLVQLEASFFGTLQQPRQLAQ